MSSDHTASASNCFLSSLPNTPYYEYNNVDSDIRNLIFVTSESVFKIVKPSFISSTIFVHKLRTSCVSIRTTLNLSPVHLFCFQ